MTDAELLQQCKDEVAKDYLNADGFPCQSWIELDLKYYAEAMTIAARLAIKKAREETVSTKIKFDWFEKGYRACERDTSADEKWNPSKAFRKEIEN